MRTVRWIMIGALIITATPAVTSADAAKNPNRVTMWNKMTDFFATVGKEDTEKRRILLERRKRRQEARVFKANQKQQRKIRKRMREQQRTIMDKVDVKRVPHGRGGVDAR